MLDASHAMNYAPRRLALLALKWAISSRISYSPFSLSGSEFTVDFSARVSCHLLIVLRISLRIDFRSLLEYISFSSASWDDFGYIIRTRFRHWFHASIGLLFSFTLDNAYDIFDFRRYTFNIFAFLLILITISLSMYCWQPLFTNVTLLGISRIAIFVFEYLLYVFIIETIFYFRAAAPYHTGRTRRRFQHANASAAHHHLYQCHASRFDYTIMLTEYSAISNDILLIRFTYTFIIFTSRFMRIFFAPLYFTYLYSRLLISGTLWLCHFSLSHDIYTSLSRFRFHWPAFPPNANISALDTFRRKAFISLPSRRIVTASLFAGWGRAKSGGRWFRWYADNAASPPPRRNFAKYAFSFLTQPYSGARRTRIIAFSNALECASPFWLFWKTTFR